MSSAPEHPVEPIGPVVNVAINKLLPDEIPLSLFNSQYLQQHPTNARAILAAAKVMQLLSASREEVEGTLFTVLDPDVPLDIKVSPATSP